MCVRGGSEPAEAKRNPLLSVVRMEMPCFSSRISAASTEPVWWILAWDTQSWGNWIACRAAANAGSSRPGWPPISLSKLQRNLPAAAAARG